MPDLTSLRDSSHFYTRAIFMSLRTSLSDLGIAEDGHASHVIYRRMLLYQALIQFLGPPNNSYQN